MTCHEWSVRMLRSKHICQLKDGIIFINLIDNSSRLNKGNHDRDSVWIYDLN